jgi:hypothetical protein
MPFNNLRLNFAYNYSPYKVNGLLPTQQGTDAFSAPWADRGYRAPYTTYNYQADWTASSKFLLSAFGGYSYRNYKDYGIPRGTRYRNSTSAIGIDGVNPAFSRGVGDVTPDNRQTTQDINERTNLNIVASYLFNAGGQHNLKGGWQLNRLANRPFGNTWADGYVQMYWNRSYSAVTIPNPAGGFRGKYGYYRVIPFILQGDTASNNQAMFFNDAWRVNKYLQINLGLRFEKEYVPSFANSALGLPSKAITFGWGDKIAPRLGFAWDPSGVGKMKIYGSWGLYYDMMKYELPRGSFGGEFWIDRYYTLDTGNPFDIKPEMGSAGVTGTFPGTLIESLNRRIPSNDPSENLIDPNLKPVRQTAMDFGYEYSLTDKSLLAFRYTFKNLDRTIEDVGILTSLGEQYFIANPGYGVTVDESLWPKGYPTDVTPKAKRTYNALEVRFEKRYANNFALSSSYVWSRLYGNYGGLASSDENGRTSPNVNRYFDLPWMAYDRNGKPSYGLLPTDRPHTFKFFGSYDLKSKLGVSRFSPVLQAYSGTVLSTEVEIDGVPIYYSYKRGDLGRTPIFTQMDFLYSHDFPGFKESQKFRFEFNVTNLFNSGTPLNKFNTLPNLNDSAAGITFDDTAQIFKGYDPRKLMQEQGIGVDPRFMWDNSYQAPRDIRLGIHFIF